ncbi:nucleotidyltransferase family protein [Rhizobium halophytocola]|uniref:MurNAc alpha-1-phosphate uridylyltransferase n=1 Tax=Rhizobium halophytocola TaxID=735519 RepID=A0ABS4E1M0_9HYPH|nr:nucleotidyltransferase family protein [Rhizobium halophytocola]MBP1851826.1 MurNAc alpha-1-phosphate uridylyltransferase [Rhizobium halophytocola]
MAITEAMVLAAGLGTRMRPLTDTTPKPLIKVAGKPLIDYALDHLKEAGVTRAAVNVHHHADQMLTHLDNYPGMEIVISDERDGLLNSGGGLVKGLGCLGRDPVFVMNADLFWIEEGTPSNLRRLAEFFDPATMDMAMLCIDLDRTTGHNGKRDFSLGPDGTLRRYQEGDPSPVVYAGAILMRPDVMDDSPDGAFNFNAYFDKAIGAGRLFGLMMTGHWITVGTPEAIGDAERRIALETSEA